LPQWARHRQTFRYEYKGSTLLNYKSRPKCGERGEIVGHPRRLREAGKSLAKPAHKTKLPPMIVRRDQACAIAQRRELIARPQGDRNGSDNGWIRTAKVETEQSPQAKSQSPDGRHCDDDEDA
jgi:hypothetical protein